MNTLPSWLKLLKYQRARGKTGLTVPFLIGARRLTVNSPEMKEKEVFDEIVALLSAFNAATPSSQSVVIAECNELHEPIAALYALDHGRPNCDGVNVRTETGSLFLERPYFASRKRTIESATEGLLKKLGDNLLRGEFSFRDGKYAVFDDADRTFIERAYAAKEPNYDRWRMRRQ